MKLKDKNIIVTGGYRGLGLAITRAYLKEGARVAICGRHQDSLKKLDESLIDYNGRFFWCPCDISEPLEVANFVRKVMHEFHSIDVLVNNASIYGRRENVLDTAPQAFREIVDINLIGTFNVLQAVLKNMVEQAYGKIICVSSSSIEANEKAGVGYHVSKLGQEGLALMLARQYGSNNVCTNIVNPYGIMQEESSPFYDPIHQNLGMDADSIQSLFVYLASPESNGVNGKIFNAIEWCKTR